MYIPMYVFRQQILHIYIYQSKKRKIRKIITSYDKVSRHKKVYLLVKFRT